MWGVGEFLVGRPTVLTPGPARATMQRHPAVIITLGGDKMIQETSAAPESPLVAVIMGSKSDWETMRHADSVLTEFGVAHECRVLSAHRTPGPLVEYVTGAPARGVEVIIAGAGGAAHLPGVIAAYTLLPVLGVPMESASLKGLDSLL